MHFPTINHPFWATPIYGTPQVAAPPMEMLADVGCISPPGALESKASGATFAGGRCGSLNLRVPPGRRERGTVSIR